MSFAVLVAPLAADARLSPHSFRSALPSRRFPFCLVWGPLPVISWLLPWIGHLGIADAEGRVHDFAGPYFVGVNTHKTGQEESGGV